MKIGIDVRCLMQPNYSGVSWYTLNICRALFVLDRQNEYVLFANNAQPVKLPELETANVRYAVFSYPNKLLNQSFNLANQPKIDRLIGGVDVWFMPNINFMAVSAACRRVVTVHDLSYLRYPEFWTLKSRLWHKIILAKKILADADAIIAVSENTKNDLIKLLKIPETKIKVIYEGVDGKFQPVANVMERERVKKKYNLTGEFILYLGTLEPRKNVDGIIAAFNQSGWGGELVIGGGAGWKSRRTRQLAARNNKIKLLGYIAEDDKRALYSLAKLFIYPSYYEGFGLPPLEAMACGLPVIVGANSAQAEVVGDAGLLVDPHNIAEIAAAIRAVATDEELRRQLIDAGRRRAAEFNWNDTATKTLAVFNDIIKI